MVFVFFCLIYFTWYDNLSVHPCCCKWHCFVFFMAEWYSIIYIFYLSVSGYLGCFYVLAVVDSAVINIGMHVFFWINGFLWVYAQEWNCWIIRSSVLNYFCAISASNVYIEALLWFGFKNPSPLHGPHPAAQTEFRVLARTAQPGAGNQIGTIFFLTLVECPVAYFWVFCAQSYPSFPGIALAPEALASSNLLEQNWVPSQIQKAMK